MDEQVEDPKTVRQRFVLIAIALGVGWMWFGYGVDALMSIALIVGLLLASRRLGPGVGKRRNIRVETPHFGPTDHERLYDPGYSVYAENCFHKPFNSK